MEKPIEEIKSLFLEAKAYYKAGIHDDEFTSVKSPPPANIIALTAQIINKNRDNYKFLSEVYDFLANPENIHYLLDTAAVTLAVMVRDDILKGKVN